MQFEAKSHASLHDREDHKTNPRPILGAILFAPLAPAGSLFLRGGCAVHIDQNPMRHLIESFFEKAPEECGAIHNERSLQLELAYWFRHMGTHVEFERPFQIPHFGGSTCPPKSNLDLLVRKDGVTTAIELKVPLNGQHPETLYSFCSDIAFVEGIVRSKFADEGYCLLVTNDRVFWADSGRGSAIHDMFRCRGSKLTGIVGKPTGKKDTTVAISGCYAPADSWRAVRDQRVIARAQYILLAIRSEPSAIEA